MAAATNLVPPFLRRGPATRGMMLGMLICLTVTGIHFGIRYDVRFVSRYLAYLAFGALIETVYRLLKDGRLAVPHASTLVTTALLVLSVPAHMPWPQVGVGVLAAVLFGKLMVDRQALRLNPMLVGRLLMMVLFADSIQQWATPGMPFDTLTSATPLGLYAAEGFAYSPSRTLLGDIRGNWEGLYTILPGAPGEVLPALALVCGTVLYLAGILDWRSGMTFLAGFAIACRLMGMPVVFHLLSGSVVFTAVYIVTDPRTMPGSKFGRLVAGLLAGILNALVRNHGFYPEGVVLAVLAVNLLTPTLDRLAFRARGWHLRRQVARHIPFRHAPCNARRHDQSTCRVNQA